MEDFDERALLERCRGGDDTAFGELVERYKTLVFGLVYRMAPERSQAEDLAQEVFLKVHRGLPYFRGEARLSTWIYRIVLNVCSAARVRLRLEPRLENGTPERPPTEAGGEDPAFAQFETRDRLERAMARLPEHYQFLLAAHYLRGVQYEALAEALNIPLGTVKTHLYRAKRQLRELLDP